MTLCKEQLKSTRTSKVTRTLHVDMHHTTCPGLTILYPPTVQVDMGLTDQDITDLTNAWLETMTAVQSAIVAAGKFTWSLFPGQGMFAWNETRPR